MQGFLDTARKEAFLYPENGVRMIAEEMNKRKGFEGINRESVRLILKKRH